MRSDWRWRELCCPVIWAVGYPPCTDVEETDTDATKVVRALCYQTVLRSGRHGPRSSGELTIISLEMTTCLYIPYKVTFHPYGISEYIFLFFTRANWIATSCQWAGILMETIIYYSRWSCIIVIRLQIELERKVVCGIIIWERK